MQASFGDRFKPLAEAVEALHKLGHDVAVVKCAWLVSDGKLAEQTWEWTCRTRETLQKLILTARRLSQETMMPLYESLQRDLAGFDETSHETKAKHVKAEH